MKDRQELARWTRSPTVPAGLAQRARTVPLAGERQSNTAAAQQAEVSRPTVIAWRRRYLHRQLDDLADEPHSGHPLVVDQARSSRPR